MAQKEIRLEYKNFNRELEFKELKTPQKQNYKLVVKKVTPIKQTIKQTEYFTPYRKEIPNPYLQTVDAKKYKNTANPLKFTKKPIENTEILTETSFFKFKAQSEFNIKYTDPAHGFYANNFSETAQTDDQTIWLASGSNGLGKYTGNSLEIISEASGLPSGGVNRVYKDSQNRLWVATSNGFCYIQNNTIYLPQPQIKENIWAIVETQNHEIYLGSLTNGLYRIANDSLYRINDNLLTGKQVEALYFDKNNNLWIGTDNYSLTRYDGKSYTHFKFYENENEDACLEIHENQQGLWFGFFHKPMINLQNNVFKEFYYCEGYPTRVFGIADNEMGMWIVDYLRGIFLN